MQSPPLELVLDVVHLGTRNLLRNVGDPDDDTASEIIRARVLRYRWGPLLFTAGIYAGAEGFRRHILKGRSLNPWH